MIARAELRRIARAQLRDAEVLLRDRRYDGCLQASGYAVEIALKARICRTLRWPYFPETSREFEGLQSLRTHNLKMLLKLSGAESRVHQQLEVEWSIVAAWDPANRYRRLGTSRAAAGEMVQAARAVVGAV